MTRTTRYLVLSAAIAATAAAAPALAAQQTVAPPDLQADIRAIFPTGPGCGPAHNFKVLSSARAQDPAGQAAGEIDEVWQAVVCPDRTRVRYLFRFAPDGKGKLAIIGFERVAP